MKPNKLGVSLQKSLCLCAFGVPNSMKYSTAPKPLLRVVWSDFHHGNHKYAYALFGSLI